jgi:hypothetical protein
MDLADMTAVAERVITDDLEYLIEKCVDIEKADYAVVAGVQIHNCELAGVACARAARVWLWGAV